MIIDHPCTKRKCLMFSIKKKNFCSYGIYFSTLLRHFVYDTIKPVCIMFAVAQLSDLAHGLLISNSVKFSQLIFA